MVNDLGNNSNPNGGNLSYRPEIDGLRAIAVLSVLFFHFRIPGFQGGYVGVDIFFVISGFLIGSILWKEFRETGKLNFIKFYERRFKRLAPAYFSVAAATTIAAAIILLPQDFREYGKSLIAASVYLSNVYFFNRTGYFNPNSDDSPLLHTWSLAIEEQFYIFLPLLFLILTPWRNTLPKVMIVLLALSLMMCIAVTPADSTATFYLFPFRAWELLAGVVLGVIQLEQRAPIKTTALTSLIGLALVVFSIAFLSPDDLFPGYLAAIPVMGTVLLILGGGTSNPVNKLLSAKWPVFIGLMSYSLYLWHWPILVFSVYVRQEYSGVLEATFWLALVFAVSYFSWKHIETPIRKSTSLSTKKIFGLVGLASLLAIGAGALPYLTDGASWRYPQHIKSHIDASGDFIQDWSRCKIGGNDTIPSVELCTFGAENVTPSVLVWGDSHIRSLKNGLDTIAAENGVAGYFIWQGGCPPLFALTKDESVSPPATDVKCARTNAVVNDYLDRLTDIKHVLLVGRWAYYANGRGVGNDNDITVALRVLPPLYGPSGNESVLRQALEHTAQTLTQAGKSVWILRPLPEIENYDSRIVSRRLAFGSLQPGDELEAILTTPYAGSRLRRETANGIIDDVAAEVAVNLIEVENYFCNTSICRAMKDDTSFYFDNNHLTNRGAMHLREAFTAFIHAGKPEEPIE